MLEHLTTRPCARIATASLGPLACRPFVYQSVAASQLHDRSGRSQCDGEPYTECGEVGSIAGASITEQRGDEG